MQVRKFEAASLDEALYLVKSELGPNALILATQQKKQRWLGRPMVEVTAAFEPPKPKDPPPRLEQVFDESQLFEVFPHRRKTVSLEPIKKEVVRSSEKGRLARQPKYVDIGGGGPRKADSRVEERLLDMGCSPELAKELSTQILFEYPQKDLAASVFLEKAIARVVSARIRCEGANGLISPGVWVPIGLSGSGKTSALVKLALYAKQKGHSVALLSFDKTRFLARETLSGYARLVSVPFYSEKSSNRCQSLIRLVDCPSLPLGGGDDEWESFERTVSSKRCFLVLDATMRVKEALRFLEQVERFSPAGIVLTKVDLVSELGSMFECLRRAKLPLLGVSMSQTFKVPFRFFDEREFGLLVAKRGVLE